MSRGYEWHSTRLFPRHSGADAYIVTGIAARCDWVVLTDDHPPYVAWRRKCGGAPRHIFVSMREPYRGLGFLEDVVLPAIRSKFVLVTGSEDVTVPNQRDSRWRAYTSGERARIDAIAQHPHLVCWFAENVCERWHPKVRPLPLGMVFRGRTDHPYPHQAPAPLRDRPGTLLSWHRLTHGDQASMRAAVNAFCKSELRQIATVIEDEAGEADYFRTIEDHKFVLCVEGGGLDPAPKAWHALIHGAIPVVRSGPLDWAYRQLPVAFVARWAPDELAPEILGRWVEALAGRIDAGTGGGRAETLRRLGLDYWWAHVESAFERGEPPPDEDALP